MIQKQYKVFRCVQYLQILKFLIPLLIASQGIAAAPFTNIGSSMIKDQNTGLIWQQCSAGRSGSTCASGTPTITTWPSALVYCTGLTWAGKIWRLPSIKELQSIVDKTKSSPAVDTTFFPGTLNGFYWSSTTYVGDLSKAWFINFTTGIVTPHLGKTKAGSSMYIRCVSGP